MATIQRRTVDSKTFVNDVNTRACQDSEHARQLALATAVFAGAGCTPGESKALAAIVEIGDGPPTATKAPREKIGEHLRCGLRTAKRLVQSGLAHLQVVGVPLVVETAKGTFNVALYWNLRNRLDAATAGMANDRLTPAAVTLISEYAGRPIRPSAERERRPAVSPFRDTAEYAGRLIRRIEWEAGDSVTADERAEKLEILAQTLFAESVRLRSGASDAGSQSAKLALSAAPEPTSEPVSADEIDLVYRLGLSRLGSSFSSDEEKETEPNPTHSEKPTLVDTVIARATAARNGAKFSRLLAGSTAGYDSRTAALLALVAMAVFWAEGDAGTAELICQRSPLARDCGRAWLRERITAKGATFRPSDPAYPNHAGEPADATQGILAPKRPPVTAFVGPGVVEPVPPEFARCVEPGFVARQDRDGYWQMVRDPRVELPLPELSSTARTRDEWRDELETTAATVTGDPDRFLKQKIRAIVSELNGRAPASIRLGSTAATELIDGAYCDGLDRHCTTIGEPALTAVERANITVGGAFGPQPFDVILSNRRYARRKKPDAS